jgi:hypothetical protein
MRIAEAKRILKAGNEREHAPSAIEEFARVCEWWANEYAKGIEESMEGTKARVYPEDIRAAFTAFIMRGSNDMDIQ